MRLVVAVLLCVACSGSARSAEEPLSARWSAPAMLAQVPADSPYVIAMLDPPPEAMKQQMFESLDKKIVDGLELSRTADRSQLDAAQRAYFAMLDEIRGKDMRHWGRELGFDPSGRFALYGLSVWPVLRVGVGDEARLRQVVARMLVAAGEPTRARTLRGRDYWQFDANDISAIASIGDGQAVFAIVPTAAVAQYLPVVLGLDKPAQSVHASGSLDKLIARYRFLPTMVGYLDIRFAAQILTGRSSSSNTELDRPLRRALGPVGDACRVDLERLARVVPRVVFGYRQLDTRRMHATMAIELLPAWTAALQRLRTVVPDLPVGLGSRPLLHVGVAAKLDALVRMLRELTTHLQEQPFTCSWFAPVEQAADELAALLDQPLPPPLVGLRGMAVVVHELSREPVSARGHAVLVGDRAHDLVALVLRMMPGAAGTTLHPDGRPVPLPLAKLGVPPALTGYVASRIDRVAVAVGPDSASQVGEALRRPPPSRSPLASFGFDLPKMTELGLLDPDDDNGLRDLAIQLDVAPEGLLIEMYGTFRPR